MALIFAITGNSMSSECDKEQHRLFKIEQLESRRRQSVQAENAPPALTLANNKKSEVGKCEDCEGQGHFSGLFGIRECTPCFGSGLDCSDIVAVIKQQAKTIRKARHEYKKLSKAHETLIDRYGRQKLKDEDERESVRGYFRRNSD